MAMRPTNQYIVTMNETDFRFEVPTDDGLAYVDYRWSNKVLLLLYIFVPVSFRGKGISSVLLEHVLNFAKEKKVRLGCSVLISPNISGCIQSIRTC